MSSCTTHSKLKLNQTSKSARSEFMMLKSASQKKSMHSNKDTMLDDSKTTPTENTVMGAILEKAPTPPNVTTAGDNSLKNTMMEMTVTGNAMLEISRTAPNATTAANNSLNHTVVETTVMGDAPSETAPTAPSVTTAANNSLNDTVTEMTRMGDAPSETAPTAPNVTAGREGGVLSGNTVKLVMVPQVTAGNKCYQDYRCC